MSYESSFFDARLKDIIASDVCADIQSSLRSLWDDVTVAADCSSAQDEFDDVLYGIWESCFSNLSAKHL